MERPCDPTTPVPVEAGPAHRAFFQTSGSFIHQRFSLVPSFKTRIHVGYNGNHAWLYFECHDLDFYDLPTRTIAADLFLAGIVRKIKGTWVFADMTAGKSSPLSVDHSYFP